MVKCPYCNSINHDCIDEDAYLYEGECNDCGREFEVLKD